MIYLSYLMRNRLIASYVTANIQSQQDNMDEGYQNIN